MDLTVSPWVFYTTVGLVALLLCLRLADYFRPLSSWVVQTGEREPLFSRNADEITDYYRTVSPSASPVAASAPPMDHDYDDYFNNASLVLCDD